jgi:hypothetical protein
VYYNNGIEMQSPGLFIPNYIANMKIISRSPKSVKESSNG